MRVFTSTRVEPVSRGGDPGRGLAATVQDPMWMLGRQRQFGELAGEDAGSPAHVTFVQTETRLDGWRAGYGEVLPYAPASEVLEAVVAGEAAGPAHSTLDRVRAGRALAAAVDSALAVKLRAAFPVPVELGMPRAVERSAALFADGLAVAAAIAGATTDAELAAALHLALPDATAARDDLTAFARWCATTFGTGPGTWVAERLERRFALAAEESVVLAAPAHTGERVEWTDLDVLPSNAVGVATRRYRIPTAIRFPGQPRDRFFELEDAALSLARIDATTTDLARLALVEFSTIYGNDWFTFPIPIAFGSIQTLNDLVVRDTFGQHELIAPAMDAHWAMYGSPTLVVPAATVAPLAGGVVEQVRFLRDELANLVWAVEDLVTDANGDVRDLAQEAVLAPVRTDARPTNAALAYRLMTDVPDNWVPFIPVKLAGSTRKVGLVEAVLPRPNSFGELVASSPRSSVLQELRGKVLAEEEVPSSGVVVRRRWFLARSADGGRHAWAARSVATGRGEGASGLRFDVADEVFGG